MSPWLRILGRVVYWIAVLVLGALYLAGVFN